MIIDIQNAITKKLKTRFPDHKVYTEEVKQGLIRPCFFVDMIPVNVEDANPQWQERSIIVDVQYMSLEDTKQKNLEMSEYFTDIFKELEILDKHVKPANRHFEIIDKVLHLVFDLDMKIKLIDTSFEEYALMQEINIEKQEG